MNHEIWAFDECPNVEYTKAIFALLLPEYERIFGSDVMNNEPCRIYNDPESGYPQLEYGDLISIRIAIKNIDCWHQEIYQLSHEMCHYAIRQKKRNKEWVLSWFEEVLCGAMSLYALSYAASHWEQCALHSICPWYSVCIADYLNRAVQSPATNGLNECTSLEKLFVYEIHKRSESDRESHMNERNDVYGAILQHPEEARCFLDYENYICPENGLTLDFDKWYQDHPCSMVKTLQSVQPVVK